MAITAAQLIVRIGADTSGAERGLQSVSARLSSFGKQAAITGGLLTAGVTLPLARVAKSALDTAADYESALNMMQAVSGATAEQMQQVAEVAKALGADMSLPATSAGDAARAMTELAKAGLSVNDTLAAARGVLQLAAAGNLSEAAAAEIASNALNAFRLSGERATDVANLLAAAANASSGEVTDMADSLKMSAAVFASAGIPIEELVTAISQMANAGIKGSDAGTSLKQMLLSLQAPSKKATQLMASLGITIYDAQGKMLPFGAIIEQFSSKLGNLSQEERNAALATIFGSDAVRAANVVLMGGLDAHQRMYDAVTRQGAAADLAGSRMRGLGGALQGLQSQIETILLEVAEPFLHTLEGLVRWVADLIPKIGELDPRIRNAALAFAAVLAAAGPVLLILGALSSAFAFLASPIGLVVLAVGALAAAWVTDFGGIREITANVFGFIQRVVETVMGFLSPFIQRELGVITGWWDENFGLIQQTVQTVMGWIQTAIQFVLAQITAFWQAHGEQVLTILRAAWDMITTIIDTALKVVLGILRAIMQVITGDWEGAWETLKSIAGTAWEGIKQVVEDGVTIISSTLALAWDGIKAVATSAWNGIWDAIRGVMNLIIGGINTLIGAWNRLEFRIPGFDVEIPSVDIPGIGRVGGGHLGWAGITIGTPDIPTIPLLGSGGIVTRPSLAILGEAGPEAVVPLAGSRLDALAERIADAVSRRPTYTINAQYRYQDERSLRDDLRLLQLLGAAT